ncbi:MAG: asparaginase [Gemmatimonas sp.]|nr:asparaginase [Gemmatimonas sp.]
MGQTVEVVRGEILESRHVVHAAVVDSGGRLRASVGDMDRVTYFRSGAKPFQAVPLVRDGAIDRFGLTFEELALCCGSHSGEPRHLEVATSMLRKVGVEAGSLACGAHPPLHEQTRRDLAEQGLEPIRVHNNCSGKHIGMVALARAHGWDISGYNLPEHPVQGRILSEVARWAGVPYEAIGLGTDGCGAVCFALPLRQMARAYATLAASARAGERDATYVVGSMTNYPEMVAGEGRICTDLMEQTAGRLFAKVGAEGLYCVGVPGAELGVAMKVEDGSSRAVAPAILSILRQLDLISEDDLGALWSHAYPDVYNTCGDLVGQVRPQITLCTPDG